MEEALKKIVHIFDTYCAGSELAEAVALIGNEIASGAKYIRLEINDGFVNIEIGDTFRNPRLSKEGAQNEAETV